MNKIIVPLAVALVPALLACGAEQRPVKVAGPPPADASSRVSNALASDGHVPDKAHSTESLVVTEWRDTGFRWGFVDQQEATLVRRFLVSIGKDETTIRADVKRCATGFTIEGQDIRGRCENVGEVPSQIQTEVDTVGAKVQQSLAK